MGPDISKKKEEKILSPPPPSPKFQVQEFGGDSFHRFVAILIAFSLQQSPRFFKENEEEKCS